MMTYRKKLLLLFTSAIGLLLLFMLIANVRHNISVLSGANAQCRIEWTDAFASCHDSEYNVIYEENPSRSGRITLHADYEHSPIIVLQLTNDGVLFCLYDNDVHLQLIRFDTKQPCQFALTNSALSSVVKSTSFYVREANRPEWESVLGALGSMSDARFNSQSVGLTFAGLRIPVGTPKYLLPRMKGEIAGMLEDGHFYK